MAFAGLHFPPRAEYWRSLRFAERVVSTSGLIAMKPSAARPILTALVLACAPALSACQTDSPVAPIAQAAPQREQPKTPTRQEAAWQCWNAVDKTHKEASLDKRADIVTKCIDDKMNSTQSPPAAEVEPKTPKSKT